MLARARLRMTLQASSHDFAATISPMTARRLAGLQPLQPEPPTTPSGGRTRGTPRSILERQRLASLHSPRAPAAAAGSTKDAGVEGKTAFSARGSQHFGSGKFESAAGIYHQLPGNGMQSPRAKLAVTARLYEGEWPKPLEPQYQLQPAAATAAGGAGQSAASSGSSRRRQSSRKGSRTDTGLGAARLRELFINPPSKSKMPMAPVWPKRFLQGALGGQPEPFRLAPKLTKMTPELVKEAKEAAASALRMTSRSPTGMESMYATKARWPVSPPPPPPPPPSPRACAVLWLRCLPAFHVTVAGWLAV